MLATVQPADIVPNMARGHCSQVGANNLAEQMLHPMFFKGSGTPAEITI